MKPFELETFDKVLHNGKAVSRIVVPPVAAVGWIPFFPDLNKMPPSAYTEHKFASSSSRLPFSPSAFSVLFASGNVLEDGPRNPSAASFEGIQEFQKMVESKNFRAALALDRVTLWRDSNQNPTRLCFDILSSVGFTPIRVQSAERTWFEIYRQGVGDSDYDILLTEERVEIQCWQRFKVSSVADYGCAVLTGKRAPSAMVKISYRIDVSEASVTFDGTHIPSLSFYVDWQKQEDQNMLLASTEQIDAFLSAGACKDAPMRYCYYKSLATHKEI